SVGGIGIQFDDGLLLRLRPDAFAVEEPGQADLCVQRKPGQRKNQTDNSPQGPSQRQEPPRQGVLKGERGTAHHNFPDATATCEATIMPVCRRFALHDARLRARALRESDAESAGGHGQPTRRPAHAATADDAYSSAPCSSATFRQRSPNTRMQVYVRLTHSAMCSTSATMGDVPSKVQTISSASHGCSSS